MLANKVIKGNQQACILLKRAGNKNLFLMPVPNLPTKQNFITKLLKRGIAKVIKLKRTEKHNLKQLNYYELNITDKYLPKTL
jgi:hypothetical protein